MKQQKFFVGDKVFRNKHKNSEHRCANGDVCEITSVEWCSDDKCFYIGFFNEEAEWDEKFYTIVERAWQENTGVQMVDEDTYIEVLFECSMKTHTVTVEKEWWGNTKGQVKWRIADEYENPEVFFEQEQTESPVDSVPPEHVALGKELVATAQEWTDKHYSTTYTLTRKDIDNGFVKIDPYFVSKMWKIGSKDDSGALFHTLKTVARFGEKNSREREIKALYAQIKRLAEIEGVNLEGDK